MVKLLELVGRRADLTHEAFLKHVSTTHLEVVDQVPEFRNRVRRYLQNHLILDQQRLSPINKALPVTVINTNAVIEVWFDSVEAIMQCFQEPRYYEIIRPDEHLFGDVAGAWGVTTDEVGVIETAGFTGRIKLFVFLMRRPELTHARFLEQWQAVRERLAATRVFRAHVGRMVENRVKQEPAERLPGMKDYDLIPELWFDSLASLTSFFTDADVTVAFDKAELIDTAQRLIYVAEEQPATAEWLRRSQAVASG